MFSNELTFIKKLALSILIISLILVSPAFACTSYAVYGNEPIYAMNFDYHNTELRFMVLEEDNTTLFSFAFKEDNYYASTVMMNDKGLFLSNQQQSPAVAGKTQHDEDELFIHELAMYMLEPDVTGLLDNIEGKRLVHWGNLSIHTLVADAGGNAAILEAGAEENEVLPIDGEFIVMTNFKNSDYRNRLYDEVAGPGSDRYKTAYEYIQDNQENFDVDHAFQGLKKTTQGHTLCSMVFEPRENCIFIALNRDFEKQWKISLDDKTLETYKGFDRQVKLHIPEEGITASNLLEGNFSNYESVNPQSFLERNLIVLAVLLLVIAAVVILILKRRRGSDIAGPTQ